MNISYHRLSNKWQLIKRRKKNICSLIYIIFFDDTRTDNTALDNELLVRFIFRDVNRKKNKIFFYT